MANAAITPISANRYSGSANASSFSVMPLEQQLDALAGDPVGAGVLFNPVAALASGTVDAVLGFELTDRIAAQNRGQ